MDQLSKKKNTQKKKKLRAPSDGGKKQRVSKVGMRAEETPTAGANAMTVAVMSDRNAEVPRFWVHTQNYSIFSMTGILVLFDCLLCGSKKK